MPDYRNAPHGIDWRGPEPDPRWQEELDRLFEPGGNLQWLMVYWEPGYPWHPVERWVVGKVWPKGMLPAWIEREWLEGQDPAKLGYWSTRESKWVSEAPPISRRQWSLWRETGSFVEPYWICQGTVGGHRYKWNRLESLISRVNDGPEQPPVPGELPFAKPDGRTFAMLADRDRVRMGLATMDFVMSGGELRTEDDHALAERARALVWDWLSKQSRDWGEHAASHALKPLWEDLPRTGSGDYDKALGEEEERLEEEFMSGAL